MTLQTEILTTEISEFLKQIFFSSYLFPSYMPKCSFDMSGKEANRTLKDKNQLLSELYEKLVPLEKEMADHQTGK